MASNKLATTIATTPVLMILLVFVVLIFSGDDAVPATTKIPLVAAETLPDVEPEVVLLECKSDVMTVPAPPILVEQELITIPNKINSKQAKLLEYAFSVAKADGHRDPTILQGLIWQESKAGGYVGHEVAGDEYGLPIGKRYYGIGQIKVAAAKDVFRRFPDVYSEFYSGKKYLKTDDEILAYLIMDDKFNIRIASKYLWMMGRNETKKPVFKRPSNYAITAYNRGLGNTYDTDYDKWHYTVSVHKHKDTFIKTFNLANNIR